MGIQLNGSYSNVGKDTLQTLHKVAQSGTKIEAAEVDEVEKAARADGDFSDGEKALIAKLREGTRDKKEIQDFQLAAFDPTAQELEFGSFNLEINANQGQSKPVYLERLGEAIRSNDSDSDDTIRKLLSDQKRFELAAKLAPGRLLEAVDILKSGNYSDEDRASVVKIFAAVPPAQQAEILKKLNADGDDNTLRDLSENSTALAAVAQTEPAVLDKVIETLKSGVYSSEDAAAVARVVAAQSAPQQQSFVKAEIQRNDSDSDDTLAALSEKTRVLENLDTPTKLQSLHVLYDGNVSAEDKVGMRHILEEIGFLTISDDKAKEVAKALEGLSDAQKTKLAGQLDQLSPIQKADLLKVLNQLNPEQIQNSLKALTAPSNKDELGSLVKLLSASHNKPEELARFSAGFAALTEPEQQSAAKLIHSLMQAPPPASLRTDIATELSKLGASSPRVGQVLNSLGLYLPATEPKAPGTEDASSRLKTVYMGQYRTDDPNADYTRDMLKVAQTENFKVAIQGSLTHFPTPMPAATVTAKETDLAAKGEFSRANLDATIKTLENMGVLSGAMPAADKDKEAKTYLAKVALFKDTLIADLQSKEGMSKADAEALVNNPDRVDIRLTPHAGYIWAEDNKWVKVDGTVTTTPALRRIPGMAPPALDKAQAFTDANLGQAPGTPGSEGHHTAALPSNDPHNLLPDNPATSWRGAVTIRDQEINANELGQSVNGRPADVTRTYNEGGNMLTGTKPNGESYAVVGRDGLLLSAFHLEDTSDPVFDAAKVDARIKAMGLDQPFASLPKATQAEIDVTIKRLKAAGETFPDLAAERKRATEFLAKIDLTKDLFAQDIGVDRKNLTFVAQPDFHIDMHMRPLGPGQMMINDFDANLKLLTEAKKKATPGSWEDKELDTMIDHAKKMKAVLGPVMDQIAQELKDSGLEVIRAPGVMEAQMAQAPVEKDSDVGTFLGLAADKTYDQATLKAELMAKGITDPVLAEVLTQTFKRHVNFMNAVPGTSNGSNKQFYMTNATSLPSLTAAYEDYLKQTHGIETVYWLGGDGGGPSSRSASEQSLDASGGLDCRENH